MAKEDKSSADAPLAGARKGAVTIHDVARVAGVSSMTVSRVMNDHPHVSKATRAKVMATVEAMNFSPNAAASSLRSALKIGLLYSNPSSSNLGEFLMGAFRQAGESGCQLMIEPSSAHPDGLSAVNKLLGMGVDGIILPPPLCDSPDVLERLMQTGVPALGFATAEPRPDTPAVMVDDFAGARLMTEHLIALGHRDIAFLRGDPMHSTARRREAGFRAAMREAGLAVRPEWVAQGYFTYRSGMDAAQQLLGQESRPTAVFASNDDMAAGVSAVAHGLGLNIPGDISIAGFDDTSVATTIWPELTTIHQPIAEMSSSAVAAITELVRRRRAGESVPIRHDVIAIRLVERASTSAPVKG
ncbi:LacI family transcriptional regulator [Novosphingobium sp. SG751A]|uniref:LacI family DNA-binding transcriptional regulator n=1 Tax=Novosphingobium sp. SG751A TaxID=2587000 RepID=UPI001555515F|nr:LacI family DNA-binding transcriptional regulator [Novosphingobium sp. SG751A]NOW48439.1 LacI family transcriptional regulator [Novosphingobium sp. SG751A]